MHPPYVSQQPDREHIDVHKGPLLLEFGTNWCGHCQAAQAVISAALSSYPHVERIKVEDGKGRALGRSFGVKLWPTLIFLKDGVEQARVVRPTQTESVENALRTITSSNSVD